MSRLQAALAFVHPDAWEQRARERERRRLVAELEQIDHQRNYYNNREPLLIDRLQQLHKEGFSYVDAKGY